MSLMGEQSVSGYPDIKEQDLQKSISQGEEWIIKAQNMDGGWGAGSHHRQNIMDPHAVSSDPATTAMSALALYRLGYSIKAGKYKEPLQRALDFLLSEIEQNKNETYITQQRNTQIQNKLGANIDASLALQFLNKVIEDASSEEEKNRIKNAIQICVNKIGNEMDQNGGQKGAAILLTIGNEILIGQIQDTNSQYISKQLGKIGVEVMEIRSISDGEKEIYDALTESCEKADIIISTGGLGPTKDDITKKTLSDFLDSPMVYDPAIFEHIKYLFSKIGRIPNEVNKEQAYHPKITQTLKNEMGTAPGLWTEWRGKLIINMAGVPYEMKHLMETQVIPRIKEKYTLPYILHRNLLTMGIPESELSLRLEDFEAQLPNSISLAYLPSGGRVKLRLSTKSATKALAEAQLEPQIEKLQATLGKDLLSTEEELVERVIGQLLKEKSLLLACAESCTGGALAERITSVSGSSDYFLGSAVTYHTQAKINILNVPRETIEKHTVVSQEVAESMARGAQKIY
ncbi:unnamed protein product, partial [Cyprideis torosa]